MNQEDMTCHSTTSGKNVTCGVACTSKSLFEDLLVAGSQIAGTQLLDRYAICELVRVVENITSLKEMGSDFPPAAILSMVQEQYNTALSTVQAVGSTLPPLAFVLEHCTVEDTGLCVDGRPVIPACQYHSKVLEHITSEGKMGRNVSITSLFEQGGIPIPEGGVGYVPDMQKMEYLLPVMAASNNHTPLVVPPTPLVVPPPSIFSFPHLKAPISSRMKYPHFILVDILVKHGCFDLVMDPDGSQKSPKAVHELLCAKYSDFQLGFIRSGGSYNRTDSYGRQFRKKLSDLFSFATSTHRPDHTIEIREETHNMVGVRSAEGQSAESQIASCLPQALAAFGSSFKGNGVTFNFNIGNVHNTKAETINNGDGSGMTREEYVKLLDEQTDDLKGHQEAQTDRITLQSRKEQQKRSQDGREQYEDDLQGHVDGTPKTTSQINRKLFSINASPPPAVKKSPLVETVTSPQSSPKAFKKNPSLPRSAEKRPYVQTALTPQPKQTTERSSSRRMSQPGHSPFCDGVKKGQSSGSVQSSLKSSNAVDIFTGTTVDNDNEIDGVLTPITFLADEGAVTDTAFTDLESRLRDVPNVSASQRVDITCLPEICDRTFGFASKQAPLGTKVLCFTPYNPFTDEVMKAVLYASSNNLDDSFHRKATSDGDDDMEEEFWKDDREDEILDLLKGSFDTGLELSIGSGPDGKVPDEWAAVLCIRGDNATSVGCIVSQISQSIPRLVEKGLISSCSISSTNTETAAAIGLSSLFYRNVFSCNMPLDLHRYILNDDEQKIIRRMLKALPSDSTAKITLDRCNILGDKGTNSLMRTEARNDTFHNKNLALCIIQPDKSFELDLELLHGGVSSGLYSSLTLLDVADVDRQKLVNLAKACLAQGWSIQIGRGQEQVKWKESVLILSCRLSNGDTLASDFFVQAGVDGQIDEMEIQDNKEMSPLFTEEMAAKIHARFASTNPRLSSFILRHAQVGTDALPALLKAIVCALENGRKVKVGVYDFETDGDFEDDCFVLDNILVEEATGSKKTLMDLDCLKTFLRETGFDVVDAKIESLIGPNMSDTFVSDIGTVKNLWDAEAVTLPRCNNCLMVVESVCKNPNCVKTWCCICNDTELCNECSKNVTPQFNAPETTGFIGQNGFTFVPGDDCLGQNVSAFAAGDGKTGRGCPSSAPAAGLVGFSLPGFDAGLAGFTLGGSQENALGGSPENAASSKTVTLPLEPFSLISIDENRNIGNVDISSAAGAAEVDPRAGQIEEKPPKEKKAVGKRRTKNWKELVGSRQLPPRNRGTNGTKDGKQEG